MKIIRSIISRITKKMMLKRYYYESIDNNKKNTIQTCIKKRYEVILQPSIDYNEDFENEI